MSRSDVHLWEVDHPYYWAEGNYYKNGCHTVVESWDEFYDEVKGWDADLNLLVRWDWRSANEDGPATLSTYWVGQRKASLWSMECPVSAVDEFAVVTWLRPRLAKLLSLWEPLTLNVAGDR
jgi:hypothetical protein